MYAMLRSKNEGLSQDTINFASKLISTPSVSLKEEDAAKLVEEEMQKLGYDKVFRDGAGNVVGIIYGREQSPNILLCSHLDTVEVGEQESWSIPPYSGKIKNGRIMGRGASDCKGGLAAQVYAGALLKRSLLPLKGNLIVAATVAEENGLSLGSRFLMTETLPSLSLMPDFVILGEPTGLGVYYGHDGWMEIDIQLKSPNWFDIEEAVHVVAEETEEGYAGRSFNRKSVDKNYFNPTSEAPESVLRFHGQLLYGENPDQIVQSMQNIAVSASKNSGMLSVKAALKTENHEFYTGQAAVAQYLTQAWSTDPFHPMIERTCQSLFTADCTVRRGKWNLDKPGMGTAGGVFLNEFKVPVIGFGPGTEEMAHSANESVDIKSLNEAVYGTASIVHGIAGIPVCGWTMDEI